MVTDPVADALTKMRNASRAKHATTDVNASQQIERLLALLKTEGYIRTYKPIGEAPKRQFRVYLKYLLDRSPVLTHIIRISKPGQRQYRGAADLPRVLNGLGRAVVSTSKGLMTDQEARRQKLGGEVWCYVW